MFVINLNLFYMMLPFTSAMRRELGGKDGQADLTFQQIGTSDFNEDVLGIKSNFSSLRVDNRWERQNLSISIVEDGVPLFSLEDWQELFHLNIRLEFLEESIGIHGFGLLQCLENNLTGWHCFISNRSLNFREIMSTHGSKSSSSADVLMQLVLQVNERVIRLQIESDVAENATNNEWSDFLSLRLNIDLHEIITLVLDSVSGHLLNIKVRSEASNNSLEAKHIVSVGSNFNLEYLFLRDINVITTMINTVHLHFGGITEFNFDTILETKILEFLIGESLANGIKKFFLKYVNVGHDYVL